MAINELCTYTAQKLLAKVPEVKGNLQAFGNVLIIPWKGVSLLLFSTGS